MTTDDGKLYFATPAALRSWFEENHGTETVLLLGYYKTGSGKPSVTWPQSVDEALCFGWIDGVRKRIDDERYFIRFTPRKPKSSWSKVNLKRFAELKAAGLVSKAGLTAYARSGDNESAYSFERQGRLVLPEAYEQRFLENEAAWAWFEKAAPSYRRSAIWWVISAKQEATKERRLQQLISDSARGMQVPPFIPRTGK